MSFTSLAFMIFVIVIFAARYIAPTRYTPYIIAAANVYFCLSFKGTLTYIVLCAAAVFGCGIYLERARRKTAVLALGLIALCVMPLVFYKYLPFFAGLTAPFMPLAMSVSSALETLLVPVGISYFSLKSASYLIDIKRKAMPAEHNPIVFFASAAFFTQFTAGPIQRPRELLPQMRAAAPFDSQKAYVALGNIAYGLVLKLCIADILLLPASMLSTPSHVHSLSLVGALFLYSVQIYTDFAGYSLISIGIAELLGFSVSANFLSPYTSRSVQEFWRRWHISLSGFLRDYVYIPLGGSRKGTVRKYLNYLIVFTLSGLWHGAGLGYIIWGALHGIYMCVGSFSKKAREGLRKALHIAENGKFAHIFGAVITFGLVSFAWLFFAIPDIDTAIEVLAKMLTMPPITIDYIKESVVLLNFTAAHAIRVAISIALALAVDIATRKLGFGAWFAGKTHKQQIVILYLCVLCVMFLGSSGGTGFIYFKF